MPVAPFKTAVWKKVRESRELLPHIITEELDSQAFRQPACNSNMTTFAGESDPRLQAFDGRKDNNNFFLNVIKVTKSLVVICLLLYVVLHSPAPFGPGLTHFVPSLSLSLFPVQSFFPRQVPTGRGQDSTFSMIMMIMHC